MTGTSYNRITYYFCFFFSSRRRHTRFKCDWSSDVCSSDLRQENLEGPLDCARTGASDGFPAVIPGLCPFKVRMTAHKSRSEERRVGKECRSRWSPYH